MPCIAERAWWHERLGLVYDYDTLDMSHQNVVQGLQLRGGAKRDLYWSCDSGSLSRTEIPKETPQHDLNNLNAGQCDGCGPMHVHSKGCAKYFFTSMDSSTNWTVVFVGKNTNSFQNFDQYNILCLYETKMLPHSYQVVAVHLCVVLCFCILEVAGLILAGALQPINI